MKLLFKNKTKYTKSVYDQFLAFHSKKYHFSYTAYTAFVVGFILLCLILQVKSHHLTIAILLCFGVTFFILWRFFHPISEVTKEYKSDKIQKEKVYTFCFYNKYFTVEDEKEYSIIKYPQLYKIFETKNFFYLYIDKNHAFLIDPEGFKKCNSSDFSKFIQKKCWWNYNKIKKS